MSGARGRGIMRPRRGKVPPPDAIDLGELYENVSEAVFQQHVIHHAHTMGYHAYHHTTVGARCPQCGTRMRGGRIVTSKGFPDLVLGREHPPRLIYLELKSKTGRLAPEQRLWRDILIANGCEWYMFRPSDWDLVVEILKGRKP